jgi:predicted phage terminase large subunit-like protein
MLFRRGWFPITECVPATLKRVRYWDFAGTEAKPGSDPDWTVGCLLGRSAEGFFYVLDIRRDRLTAQGVQSLVLQTASLDGRGTPIVIEQEPGSAGKFVADMFVRLLAGFEIRTERPTGDKTVRARPLAAQAEAGNVLLLAGDWNAEFLDEFESFPGGTHDDQVDATTQALSYLFGTGGVDYVGAMTQWRKLLEGPSK